MPLGFSFIGSTVTFSSGERHRALWALFFGENVVDYTLNYAFK